MEHPTGGDSGDVGRAKWKIIASAVVVGGVDTGLEAALQQAGISRLVAALSKPPDTRDAADVKYVAASRAVLARVNQLRGLSVVLCAVERVVPSPVALAAAECVGVVGRARGRFGFAMRGGSASAPRHCVALAAPCNHC
jgi:hypothetical protein